MLSNRAIGIGAVVVVVVTVGSMGLLLFLLRGAEPQVLLEVVRTSTSIGAGTGGGAALWLAARKQRSTELDLAQKGHDATETQVTDLYGKAAEQLGNDKAPVRLAGIYALERLANGHPAHRHTIVDLICAYLRMPFDPADDPQEREVRQVAQNVLISHLRADAESFWPDIVLNLAGATLSTFTCTRCRVRSATFAGAEFVGPAVFRGTEFAEHADFRNVRFTGLGDFRRVTFGGEGVTFRGARFEGEVDFGTHTEAALTGALVAGTNGVRRKWPAHWDEQPATEHPGWCALVFTGGSGEGGTGGEPVAS
ncbi:pentapeptide repeat-containing protein [Saccharopolyspora rosea]|uniref:pentapeptide repeat-containing protein n=1 Tax=Saccharopolyspora rosea TaxID=524884 RepID=UPI0031E863FC